MSSSRRRTAGLAGSRSRSWVAAGITIALVTATVEVGTAAAAPAPPFAAGPCTTQTYVVPAGVHQLAIRAVGQAGHDGSGSDVGGVTIHGGGAGGLGAAVTNSVAVTPGQTLYAGVASPALAGGAGGSVYYSGGILTAVGAQGGNGTFVTSSPPDEADCSFDPASILIVAGGGGGGGYADRAGPGGTGGAAAAPGNPGGQNEDSAGSGGGAGTVFTAGTGGAAGLVYEDFFICPTCRHRSSGRGGDGGKAGSGVGVDRAGSVGGTGGSSDNQPAYYGQPGGGGGGGIFGGGGGGGSGAGFTGQGSGAGGGGGGGSYPDTTAHPTTDAPSVSFVPTYDTTTTIASSANPSLPGQSVTFTAQVSPTPGRRLTGGTISFFDQGNVADPGRQTVTLADVVPVTLDGTGGSAAVTVPTLSPGPHLISASYSGNGIAAPGSGSTVEPDARSSARLTQVVAQSQTLAFTSTPGTRTAFGATYTPTATATSGLPVTFSIDASAAAVCTISGSAVSFVAAGTCVIDADQGGNGTYLAAPQVQQRVTVLGAEDQAITFTSTPPTDFRVSGPTYTPTAIGGASGQPVVFSVDRDDPCVVYAGEVYAARGGLCTIHANQAGGNGYSPAAQVDQVVTVPPQAQKVMFTSTAPTDPKIGDTYLVKATTDSGQGVVLSLDAGSTGCTLTDVRQSNTGFNIWQGTVTYTRAGTCVIDGDSPAITGEYTAAPQSRQTSTVLGTPQSVTFTSTDPQSPTYGGTYDIAATGGDSGNPVTFASTTPATCTVSGATVSFVGAGACTIHADQAGDTTYAAAPTATKTLTVARAVATVTGPTQRYVYGAVPNAFLPSYDGLVNGDTAAALSVQAHCALAASPDAGTHPISCSGASDPNYTFTYVPGAATIEAAPLTITAADAGFGYGSAPPTITATYDGLVNGDTAVATSPSCGTSASSSSPVGNYASSCHGAADPNYDLSYVDGTVIVTQATLTITPVAATTTYGSLVPIITPSYAGLRNDDTAPATLPTCTTPTTRTSAVGTYASLCSDAADPNYAIDYAPGTVTVTPAALDVAAPTLTMTYGDAVPTLTPSYDGLVAGDSAPATGATCRTVATSHSPVGHYPITCTGAVDPNYTISYAAGTLDVGRAALTVSPKPASTVYGSSAPSITPTYDGLVAGDLAPATPPTCTSDVTPHSPAGEHPSSCAGATDPNYTIGYAPGTVTVTRAALTVVAPDAQQTYGADLPDLVPTYLGFVADDTAVATPPSCSADASTTSDVGTYPTRCTGAADPNYDISYVEGQVTITPAPLAITASDATTAYGTVAPIFPAYAGLAGGDHAPVTAPTCGTTADATSDVGTYPSSCTAAADPNYTISYVTGTVTVTPGDQSIVTTFVAPTHPVVGGTLALTAAPSASGTEVRYARDPASADSCTVTDSGTVSFTRLGTCIVTMSRPAGLDYAAAAETVRFVVDTIAPTWRGASTLPAGQVGAPYSHRVVDSATPAPTDELVSGTLPPGLELVGDPMLVGTPTRAGTYSFVLAAANRGGRATKTFTITVAAIATPVGSAHPSGGSPTSGPAAQNDSGSLATTGANLLELIAAAAMLLGIGMVLNRRRRYNQLR